MIFTMAAGREGQTALETESLEISQYVLLYLQHRTEVASGVLCEGCIDAYCILYYTQSSSLFLDVTRVLNI